MGNPDIHFSAAWFYVEYKLKFPVPYLLKKKLTSEDETQLTALKRRGRASK